MVKVTIRKPKWLTPMIYILWTVNCLMTVNDSYRCLNPVDIMDTQFFIGTFLAMYGILVILMNSDFVMSCYFVNTTFIVTTWLFYGKMFGYSTKKTTHLVMFSVWVVFVFTIINYTII